MGIWYRWLWTHIGGRPWTFIIRDSWHNWAVLWMLSLLTIGFFIASWLTTKIFLSYMGILTLGYILGHLFWGKTWIKGQKGEK